MRPVSTDLPEILERPARRATAWWLGPEGGPGPVMYACLAAAAAAPSLHNTQPWLFHPREQAVDVYADRSRWLAATDPSGRELMLSVGAAVLNLKVALRAHGRLPLLHLEPGRGVSGRLVRISPGPPARIPEAARALAWAIPRRRSNRWPFASIAPSGDVLGDLMGAAAAEGGTLRVAGRDTRRRVLELVRLAEQELTGDLAYRHELAHWSGARGRRDGITRAAAGPRVGQGVPLRDLGLALPGPRRPAVRFEPVPTIAVLYGEDTPEGWLRSGQALERTLLTATLYGVATTLLTQPLEIPRLRDQLRDPLTGQPAQAILRLGYARRPAAASPRRPVPELLIGKA